MSASGRQSSAGKQMELDALLLKCVPGVQHYLIGKDREDFRGMTLKVADSGNALLIFKRVSADGTPEVVFGNGDDFLDALWEVNKAISTNKWKVDKPWKGGEVKNE